MSEREIVCARRIRDAAYELAIAATEAEIFSSQRADQLSRVSERASRIASQIEKRAKLSTLLQENSNG